MKARESSGVSKTEFIDLISVWYQKRVCFWQAQTRWISTCWCIYRFCSALLRWGLYWQEQQVNSCFTHIFSDFSAVKICQTISVKDNEANCLMSVCFFPQVSTKKCNTAQIGISPVYYLFRRTSLFILTLLWIP